MKSINLFLFAVSCMLLLNAKAQTINQSSFHPGELWKDNNGIHINAHGGGVLFHKGTYYWYGEHKVSGLSPGEKMLLSLWATVGIPKMLLRVDIFGCLSNLWKRSRS
jgi:hypothetical protein